MTVCVVLCHVMNKLVLPMKKMVFWKQKNSVLEKIAPKVLHTADIVVNHVCLEISSHFFLLYLCFIKSGMQTNKEIVDKIKALNLIVDFLPFGLKFSMLDTSSFFRVKEGNSVVELQVEMHLFLPTHIHRTSF